MEESSIGRLATVLTSPVKTFRSIDQRPTWLLALIVVILISLGVMLVAVPKVDWAEAAREQIAASGRDVPEDQVETQVAVMEKFGSALILGATVIAPWIVYPLLALFFLGVFKVLGGEPSFEKSLSVLVYGFVPWTLAGLLSLPVALSSEQISAEQLEGGSLLLSSLSFLADEDTSPALETLLRSLDLFSFWSIALLAVGFSITARVSRGKAAAGVVVPWVVYVAIKVGWVAASQALFS